MEPLDDALGGVRQLRQSRRGLAGGQLLFCLAESILAGGRHPAHLDPPRGDEAGLVPRPVAEVRALETTARRRRGSTGQCPAVVAELARTGADLDRVPGLPEWCLVFLDLDSTTTGAEGELKDRTPDNYQGELRFGSLFCTWAERRRVLADGLRPGISSDRSISPQLVLQAVRARPEGHGEVRLRADGGFSSAGLLDRCQRHRLRFGVVPHYQVMWQLRRHSLPTGWRPDREVAGVRSSPTRWRHERLRLLMRRLRIEAKDISPSPKSRRRNGIPSVKGDWP